MKSILTELYEGRIFPAEQYSPRSEEYRQIHQSHYKHYDNFIETLSKLEPPLDKQISNPHFKWGSNVSPSRALPWFRLRRGFAVPFLLAASSGRPCYFLPSSILSFSSCSLM